MGDSFQFTFNNQDSVGIHKTKSHSKQERDNLRQQEFKEKKFKEEIVDLEKEVKDDKKGEVDTFDNKNNNMKSESENKKDEVEIQTVWKVKAFCEAEDLDKLEKHILEEKDSNVFEQNYWVQGTKKTYQAIRDLENVRKVNSDDSNFIEMNLKIDKQYSIGFIENLRNWPKYVHKIEREKCSTSQSSTKG